MRKLWWLLLVVLLVICAVESALLGFHYMRAGWQGRAGDTPVQRGRMLAEEFGCFACHGPGGAAPIANPGSMYDEVPSWTGGTWMMWNETEADVRAWIADGHPPGRSPDPGALIAMPAYGHRLSGSELDDLTAYVLAVSLFGFPQDPQVAEGRELAVRLGCLGCHGPEGRGLVSNPGSFKGYIPDWNGDDYLELVQSDDEFRQWVLNGISDRFRANPAARRFLETQPTKMPAYADLISDEQVDALLAFAKWVRQHPRGTPPAD